MSGEQADCAEFELVLACLRWPQTYVDSQRVRSLARGDIDWSYLLEIVHHHKVVPLFFLNLDAFAADLVPGEAAAALRSASRENAAACLWRTEHLRLLSRQFREQGIDFRLFKGIPLAKIAYQEVAVRDAGDTDLLVRGSDIFSAERV